MTSTEQREGRGGLGTVRNAAHLLDLLAHGPAYQQLSDLAQRSDLSLPTAHRLLRSLTLAGLVAQDPQSSRYALGPEVTRLSSHYLSRLPILGAISPYLIPLRDQLESTVYVQTLVRGEVVYVDRLEGPGAGPYRDTQWVYPALLVAGGRLLAARSDEVTWQSALDCIDEEARPAARAAREEWAGAEWLSSDPVHPAMSAEIAVPVFGAHGCPVASLSAALHTPEDEQQTNRHVISLSRAARAAGRTLGHA